MPKGLVTNTYLEDIADAIRAKLGTETTYLPEDMAAAILSIPTGGGDVTIVPFSSGTDAEIAAMINAAHNGDIDLQQDGGWSVGDTRAITVGAFTGGGDVSVSQQNVNMVITSFDEYMSCGNVLQFDFSQSFPSTSENLRMNSTSTNNGGYGSSEMKTVTLPALVNALPEWLKTLLIEFSVLASSGNASSTIATVTGNKLALRSEVEIFGTTSQSFSGEGTQLDYFKTASVRNSYKEAWLRSPNNIYNTMFCIIDRYEPVSATRTSASSGKKIAPFGCL